MNLSIIASNLLILLWHMSNADTPNYKLSVTFPLIWNSVAVFRIINTHDARIFRDETHVSDMPRYAYKFMWKGISVLVCTKRTCLFVQWESKKEQIVKKRKKKKQIMKISKLEQRNWGKYRASWECCVLTERE